VNEHSEALKRLRVWNRIGIGALIGAIVVLGTGVVLSSQTRMLSELPASVGIAVAIAVGLAMVTVFVAYLRLYTFECPRCHRAYYVKSWWSGMSATRKCVHCGLEMNTDA
jgi:hypothetical protein